MVVKNGKKLKDQLPLHFQKLLFQILTISLKHPALLLALITQPALSSYFTVMTPNLISLHPQNLCIFPFFSFYFVDIEK